MNVAKLIDLVKVPGLKLGASDIFKRACPPFITRQIVAPSNVQDPEILSDCLLFMVRAGSWLTEFVSKEAGIPVDSSEHESSAQGLQGLSKASRVLEIEYIPYWSCAVVVKTLAWTNTVVVSRTPCMEYKPGVLTLMNFTSS